MPSLNSHQNCRSDLLGFLSASFLYDFLFCNPPEVSVMPRMPRNRSRTMMPGFPLVAGMVGIECSSDLSSSVLCLLSVPAELEEGCEAGSRSMQSQL